jgi:NifB/MoaA-like Fe-S oxidoreductase
MAPTVAFSWYNAHVPYGSGRTFFAVCRSRVEYQPNLKNIMGNGGIVVKVDPGSIAARLGVQPGDAVVAIDDHPMRDVIDYRFAVAEERIELHVRRDEEHRHFVIEKDVDEDLGLEFSEPLWDRLRTCNNKCPFCFLTQMPKGFRKTLYLKDDDYRLSFLYGNFVTLTNLKDDDWRRIEEQRLTPMYVSVHATDRYLRSMLLGKPDVPDVIEDIKRLGRMGVEVHTQFVVCPGLNDGEVLRESVEVLAALHPVVQTIAAVPVGLTKFRFTGKAPQSIRAAIRVHETPEWIDTNWERQALWSDDTLPGQQTSKPDLGFCARSGANIPTDIPLRTFRRDEAAAVIDLLEPYQQRFRKELGYGLVYPSDEFYLLAEQPLPPARVYDGYDQIENGVGMVRKFQDDWDRARHKLPGRLHGPRRIVVATGTLAAPVLRPIVERINRIPGVEAVLHPVLNDFFGETVTVAGLLTGGDVVGQLKPLMPADLVVLPRVMFDFSGERTIDEWSLERISEALGAPVVLGREPIELVRAVRALARQSAGVTELVAA